MHAQPISVILGNLVWFIGFMALVWAPLWLTIIFRWDEIKLWVRGK